MAQQTPTDPPGVGRPTTEKTMDRSIDKDRAARTGQGGLGSTGGAPTSEQVEKELIDETGGEPDTTTQPGEANTPGGALNTGPGAGNRGMGTTS